MGANDIPILGMALALASVLASLVVYRITRVGLEKELLISVGRMTLQLAVVGVYITFIFELNHPAVNIGYIFLMVGVANYSLLRNAGMVTKMFRYTFPALLLAVFSVIAYFFVFVFRPTPLYEAAYLIPVAGMLLGNSMNRTIVTMERFYNAVKRGEERYAALLAMGATLREATAPFLKEAYRAGLAPSLANMAAMGIAFLPGMMTGQILGGSSPTVAVKYQIAIVLAIFVSTDIASILCITFSMRRGFDRFGFLRNDIFKEKVVGKPAKR
jgi:putative ABC transport system permease protein